MVEIKFRNREFWEGVRLRQVLIRAHISGLRKPLAKSWIHNISNGEDLTHLGVTSPRPPSDS